MRIAGANFVPLRAHYAAPIHLICRKVVCPERSEPPKAGANGLHKVGAEGGITIVVSPSMVTGLENF